MRPRIGWKILNCIKLTNRIQEFRTSNFIQRRSDINIFPILGPSKKQIELYQQEGSRKARIVTEHTERIV
jgi:hypothetical protein